MLISPGVTVLLEYSLSDASGNPLESNVGQVPLQYVHGQGEIIPGLEKALEGLAAGECRKILVAPGQGYGEPDSRAVIEAAKSKIPAEALKVGTTLQTLSKEGVEMNARVIAIHSDFVVLDFNHPYAGMDLYFEVKILEVLSPKREGSN